MVLGGRAFGKCLALGGCLALGQEGEALRLGSVPFINTGRTPKFSLSPPFEDREKKQRSASQREGAHQEPNLLAQ